MNPASAAPAPAALPVLLCGELSPGALAGLLGRFGLRLAELAAADPIPGSFWGEPEAGLVGTTVSVRPDTPVHSALHEACHVICMDAERRSRLHTDAGGDFAEEDATCYLQLLLAEFLPGFGFVRAAADMDAWGYSFRLGSAAAWFERDAAEARGWLVREGLIDRDGAPRWRLRA